MQFLVIARVVEGKTLEEVLPFVRLEGAKIWEYYVATQVRAVYYISDMSGAVLLYEGAELAEVQQAMEQLPMVQAKLLSIEILPLKPYTGFEALFAKEG